MLVGIIIILETSAFSQMVGHFEFKHISLRGKNVTTPIFCPIYGSTLSKSPCLGARALGIHKALTAFDCTVIWLEITDIVQLFFVHETLVLDAKIAKHCSIMIFRIEHYLARWQYLFSV